MIRAALKGIAEATLVRSGVAAFRRSRSRGLILAYHNIVRDEGAIRGDAALHLPRRRFSDQLDLLTQSCEVVPLEAILSTPAATGRPRVAITFDDAYRGAVRMGVEELARRGLPATIFVAPAYVGGRSFWWDELSDRERRRGITAEFREIALNRCRGRDQQVRDYASRYELEEVAADGDMVAAAEAELHDAVAVPGITLGSHSWSHSNLAALTPDELDQEMVQPLRWLHARYDSVIPWLSYPYGRSSASVVQAAAAAGYVAALRVSGGWLPAEQPSPYALPRFNVPSGLSNDGFALRLAGFFAGGEE